MARTWNPDYCGEVFRAVVTVTSQTGHTSVTVYGPYVDRASASRMITMEGRSWWNTRNGNTVTGHVERAEISEWGAVK